MKDMESELQPPVPDPSGGDDVAAAQTGRRPGREGRGAIDLVAAGAALARRSRAAQGLPPKVESRAALARTAELLRAPHVPDPTRPAAEERST